MNYLAHIFLSFDNQKVVIGNVIADFVKGNKFELYEEPVKKGILIHREIDSYTDSHPIVKQGKRRLSEYRHYSGVIIDMFYDHFLAKNWNQYSKEVLTDFTQRNYKIIAQHEGVIPEKAKPLFHFMSLEDWLYNYQFISGLHTALNGMSKRTTFESGMERATQNLEKDYDAFEKEFELFFPEIINHIDSFTAQLEMK